MASTSRLNPGFARLAPVALVISATALAIGVWIAPSIVRAQDARPSPAAEALFSASCAMCHGAGGAGGDRGPALANSSKLRGMQNEQIAGIIRSGTTGGMPPFASLSAPDLNQLVTYIRSKNEVTASNATTEQIAAGETFFFGKGDCASCHAVAGRGGARGPDLTLVGARSTGKEIEDLLSNPTAQMGSKKTTSCPGWAFCPDIQWAVANVTLKDGAKLRGFVRNRGEHDMQLQTFDGKFHLFTDNQYQTVAYEPASYMPPLTATPDERRDLMAYLLSLKELRLGALAQASEPTAEDIAQVVTPKAGDWPSYDGSPSGNRYSGLSQINRQTVSKLRAQWTFTPGGTGLQTTPIVVDGVMYVTGAQQVCAVDGRTGRSIWCTARASGQAAAPAPAPPARAGGAGGGRGAAAGPQAGQPGQGVGGRAFGGAAGGNGPNRGVAILGDRLYFVSDDAYLVSLNRITGGVVWTQPLPDPQYTGRYYNTAAPLVIGDLIIAGVAGGDGPLRGFLTAFKANTGELAWRLWTIPLPGEPLSETWTGDQLPRGGGATWGTGSYDVADKTLYWAVGNPYPTTNGDNRGGDNLYSNSILAIDPKNGKVKWHYQVTPHDLHDYDAISPLVLADVTFRGQPRKVLMQGSRNGYFYVLDRTNGQFLLGKPFVKKLTWSSGIDAKGVPILTPNNYPTAEGTYTCPNVRGATNWYSSSFNPQTGYFYVSAAESCGLYRKTGGVYAGVRDMANPDSRLIRALNINTGEFVWEKPMVGAPDANYGGVLTTAGGLLFHGEGGGAFAAVDTATGKTLWSYPTNENWRATAMSYMVDGKQYVAIAAGGNILAFALGE